MSRNIKIFSTGVLLLMVISSLAIFFAAGNHTVYSRDGNNPTAEQKQTETAKKQPTVAILLFDKVQIIDYSGPWEVFGQAGFKVFTVAEKSEPVTTIYGQKVLADYTFDNS